MQSRSAIVVAVFLSLLAGLTCAKKSEPLRYPGAPVILISIDTLRSDHLPSYGYASVETPNIDALRRDSILFRNAYSHCPMTLPSHLSMLTGLLPLEHGIRDNVGFRFDAARHLTLPVLLKRHGYRTGAAVSSYVLRSSTGMSAAFDFYDDAIAVRPDARFVDYQRSGFVTEAVAEKWIGQQGSFPFFFLFHIYEPHVPYTPPEPYRTRYGNSYDAEIATSDAIIGKLLNALRTSGVYDRAIIVLTSDHGEGLGDHGERQHSILLYREAIQVPLLVKLPNRRFANTTVDAAAQLIDIFPTVTSLLDTDPGEKRSGLSLITLADGGPSRRIYSETEYPRLHFGWSSLRSLIDGRTQLIESAEQMELYDLVNDPSEKHDVAPLRRADAFAMRSELHQYPSQEAVPSAVDPDDAAKLAALGYVGSARRRSEALANPKDFITIVEEIRLALQSGPDQAIPSLRQLAKNHPEMVEVWIQLGNVLSATGRFAEAADAYKGALHSSVTPSVDALLGLAQADLQQGALPDAEKSASLALRESPREAHLVLAQIAMLRGDLNAAADHVKQAAGDDPQPGDLVMLADIAAHRGGFQESLDLLSRAERSAADRGIGSVARIEAVRGDVLARTGHPAEATAAYEHEVSEFPSDIRAWANLAVLYFAQGNRKGCENALERMLTANPTPAARRLAAKTRAALRSQNEEPRLAPGPLDRILKRSLELNAD